MSFGSRGPFSSPETLMLTIDPEVLSQLQARGGTWAAYQNIDLASASQGHVLFLKYGPGCTFESPPEKCPDTPNGLGWRYAKVGFVDLTTGQVVEPRRSPC